MDDSLSKWFKEHVKELRSADHDKLVSGFSFFGTNPSNPSASILEMFKNPVNHVDATFSIIGFSKDSAEFDPKTSSLTIASDSYPGYIQKLGSFPGFITTSSESVPITVTNNVGDLKNQITQAYLPNKKTEIGHAIDRLIGSILSFEHNGTSNYAATHLTVTTEEANVIAIYTARLIFILYHDQAGLTSIGTQQSKIEISRLQVNSGYLTTNASQMVDVIGKKYTQDQILQSITTPYTCT